MRPTQDNILAFMRQPDYRPLRIRELARALKVPHAEYRSFRRLIDDMVQAGDLVELRRNRYALPGVDGFTVGQLHGHQGGFGFVTVDPEKPDVFISQDNMGRALHGDTVMVRLYGRRRGLNPEGAVARVVERGREPIVGTYRQDGGAGVVVPDDPRITRNIVIAREDAQDAKIGQKVVVHVTDWTAGFHLPTGRITEVLGYPDSVGMEILALIRSFDLPLDFPDPVLNESNRLSDTLSEGQLEGRLDLRECRCFTIDPVLARDFDDAVSIEPLDGGRWRLGVHIADVSAYVPEGSLIDREALYRGTSVYLVDRVIPMLPHRLTNEICSLNPGVDRLTLSVFMDIDAAGDMTEYAIRDSVIRSARRFTYEEAQKWIDDGDAGDPDSGAVLEDLRRIRDLSRRLLKRRMAQGSLDFDLPEPLVLLDADGVPVDVRKEERLDSHRLIEECMLLANRTVAGHLLRKEMPALYRVHEKPSGEKLTELLTLLTGFGHQLSPADVSHPKKLQRFLESIHDQPDHVVINDLVIRSMKKARYSVDNAGHYGLAFDEYTHFTSPIRRYPDLVVHRLLRELQRGAPSSDRIGHLDAMLRKAADISSQREKLAEEVERESVKLKQTEYMEGKIGEEYEGVISGVVQSGIFVELEDSLIDGMVHISNITDDYYVFDRDRRQLAGTRTKRVFRLGARVRIRVLRADRRLRRIDFELVRADDTLRAKAVPERKAAGRVKSRPSSRSARTSPGRPSGGGGRPGKRKRR